MRSSATLPPHPARWSFAGSAASMRWAGIATTMFLLVSAVAGAYRGGLGPLGDDPAATEHPAPLVAAGAAAASPTVLVEAPANDTEAFEQNDCTREKTYQSEIRSRTFLRSPEMFGPEATASIDQMQLQYWSFGPGVTHRFAADDMDGVEGLVMDSVTKGLVRATFEGPVVINTWYGSLGGKIDTAMPSASNTVELGPGESVLYQTGTPFTVENLSDDRGFGVERLILYSGDDSTLVPTLEDIPAREPSVMLDPDAGDAAVSVRLDGAGIITAADYPAGWRNTLILMEFVITPSGDWELLPPTCEPSNPQQIRDIDEMQDVMQNNTGQYIGYLVWLGQGGMG